MFLFKYVKLVSIPAIFAISFVGPSYSEELDLGATDVHGKKDEPETLTFISRQKFKLTAEASTFNASERIKPEISNNPLFDVVVLGD